MRLTRVKGFYPYMMVVFFNTFIDLGHKILIQDALYQTSTGTAYTILSAIINALILLPYILLFTPSGFLADKFPKAQVLRITAAVAIPMTLLITWCYYQGYFWGAFLLTLLLAIQSALNSPAKYGYIKEIFGKEHLSQANAIVQTLAIVSILAATFIFTYIFSYFITAAGLQQSNDKSLLLQAFAPAGFLLIVFSLLETLMTFRLPQKEAADPKSHYEPANYFRGYYLKSYLHKANKNHVIFTCMIGLSIFWAVNQVLLASYGAYLKEHIGNISVIFAQGSLAMGGIGILLGALYAGKVSKGFVETGLLPVATAGISLGLFLLPSTSSQVGIVLLFLGYGFFGGMLIVPLNSLIQFNAPRQALGKILSANNFMQNCFMIGFLGLTVFFSFIGMDSLILLYGLFVITLAGAIYTLITLPQSLIRYLIYFVASKFYRLSVYQLDNLPSTGGVLLLGNHVSFIDWAILQIACPRPIRFVMERSIYETWYLNWLLKKFKVIPIARGASHDSLREINAALNAGDVVALFPEGRLSRNGQLGAFRTGFERAAEGAKAVIVPFYIHGLWGAKASYASGYYKKLIQSNNRRVSVIYGEVMGIDSKAQIVQQKVRELSIKSWKLSTNELGSIQAEWLYKAKKMGHVPAIISENGATLTNSKLLALVLFFNKKLKPWVKNKQNVGILLPASSGGIIANLSLLCLGKTIVNLNYTTGDALLTLAKQQASIETVITSRLFVEKIKSRGIELETLLSSTSIMYLEDFQPQQNKLSIVANLVLTKLLPLWLLKLLFIKESDINNTAAILFSSGSEGKPKGIELTHRNLLSNVNQVASVFGVEEKDIILNCLPLFHAFGLTVTTLLPLLKSIPVVCYPDPTNSLAIAKLIFRHKVTLLCGTSTFLGLYARNNAIHPMMLSPLRMVVAGAEKLSPKIYQEFKRKFNLEIYEGYGATEVAPVASCNLPDVLSAEDWHIHTANKPGTVGLPLPGCAFRVVDPLTLEDLPVGEEGLVLIGGTQIMKGYLNMPEKSQEVLIEEGDFIWYKTGDKGRLDSDGYLTIVDRYSRFAKIGGEMVSLAQLEEQWQQLIKEENAAVMAVAVPDDKKGEQLALVYSALLSATELMKTLMTSDLPKLMLPKKIKQVEELPKLGNGKLDYQSAKQLVMTVSDSF
ncbi:acyl-[ACP]--phospholipid O-acyltransferase [Legionella brunensis]|uniref:2-acylglycerophosphoethanolamine acyltransferase n=1 Tax=Legionella brunensis TaxID=29422 RepID=A0A0W0STI5_9GAMM|nr:acyl-[ACP]--phospholipid O-acyltransferase [Legionella brunensis]KTC86572.1 2-acylglycerophosphoethanolamine acyltransferase [Legionella brunensis]